MNSDDVISRESAIQTVFRMRQMCDTNDIDDYTNMVLCALNILPTIDQKRGKWTTKKDECGIGYQICSNCETEIQLLDRHGFILRVDMQNAPYCPNCGAKMDVANNDVGKIVRNEE